MQDLQTAWHEIAPGKLLTTPEGATVHPSLA
jgi:hypothetical protein